VLAPFGPYTALVATLAILMKLGKLFAVVLLGAGSIGTVFARDYADKQRFAYFLAGPGLGLCWGLGVGLTHVAGVSLFSTWIVGSMLLSLISLNALLYVAGREGRSSRVTHCFILLPLAATLTLMVTRPG
jgi:hypothetical protein